MAVAEKKNRGGISELYTRTRSLMSGERHELSAIVLYSIIVSLLSLAVPIAVQSLVNSVALGGLGQQLVVLTLVVILVLSFSALLNGILLYTVEMLQRRMFIRLSLSLAERIPRYAMRSTTDKHGPEFLNPFLEISSIHSTLWSILLGGIGLFFQVLVGLLLLAFYHPLLLVVSFVLLLTVCGIFFILGSNAIETADEECSAKYDVLIWLEDMARMPLVFKTRRGLQYGIDRADQITSDWLSTRERHFAVIFRQNIAAYTVNAIGSGVLLGVGGYLVINNQLTLGQLVAAELVMNAALSGLTKFGKYLSSVYDFAASAGKLQKLLGVVLEQGFGDDDISVEGPAKVEIMDLALGAPGAEEPLVRSLNLTIEPGDDIAIYGRNGSGKSYLAHCLYGLAEPLSGKILLDGHRIVDISQDSLRRDVVLIGEAAFFHGTLEENLRLGQTEVSIRRMREVLRLVGLEKKIDRLQGGLTTEVGPGSSDFSQGELVRFAIARALLKRPRLLILDQSLDGIDDESLQVIISLLTSKERGWTFLLLTHDRSHLPYFEKTYTFRGGMIVQIEPNAEVCEIGEGTDNG